MSQPNYGRSRSTGSDAGVRPRTETVLDPNTGKMMTQEEVIAQRERDGMCKTCGEVRTHKKRFAGISMVPLDNKEVKNGVCLKCKNNKCDRVNAERRLKTSQKYCQGSLSFGENSKVSSRSRSPKPLTTGRSSIKPELHVSRSIDTEVKKKSYHYNRRYSYQESGEISIDSGGSKGISIDSRGSKGSKEISIDSRGSKGSNDSSMKFTGRSTSQPKETRVSMTQKQREYSPPHSNQLTDAPSQPKETRVSMTQKQREYSPPPSNPAINTNDNAKVSFKTFEDILEFQNKHFDDSQSVILAIKEMTKLASEQFRKKEIENLGPIIVQAVNVAGLHPKSNTDICKLMYVLSDTGNNERKKELGQNGCVDFLLQLMKKNLNVYEVQDWATKAIQSLIQEESNCARLLELRYLQDLSNIATGKYLPLKTKQQALQIYNQMLQFSNTIERENVACIVDATCRVMQIHYNDFEILSCAFDIILRILELGYWDMEELSDVTPLFKSMKNFSSRPTFQLKAMQIICAVTYHQKNFRAPEGLYQHLLDLLENSHLAEVPITEEILDLFKVSISNGHLTSRYITELKLIINVCRAIEKKPNERSIIMSALDMLHACDENYFNWREEDRLFEVLDLIIESHYSEITVMCKAISFLRVLAQNQSNDEIIKEKKVIRSVRHVIHRNMANEKIINGCFTLLISLTEFCDYNQFDIYNMNDLIVDVMTTLADCDKVQIEGVTLLNKLSVYPGTKNVRIVPKKEMVTVLNVMRKYPTDLSIQNNGCTFFKNCIFQERNIPNLQNLDEDFMIVLLAAVEAFPECQEAAFSTLQILFGM